MQHYSINPFSLETLAVFPWHSQIEIQQRIDCLAISQKSWKKTSFTTRVEVVLRIAALLKEHKSTYALLICQEMGKLIHEAEAEIEKCILQCKLQAENAELWLSDRWTQNSHGQQVCLHAQALGVSFLLMPWNYPFWQVFRAAVAALFAGNTIVLRHAPNTNMCASAIENLFKEAFAAYPLLLNVFCDHEKVEQVIAHPSVQSVHLTGSEQAGKAVSGIAAAYLKKCVLELGGNDPFIVLESADVSKVIPLAYQSRTYNSGQTCIAAKRFYVHKSLLNDFIDGITKRIKNSTWGDPLLPETTIAPLARGNSVEVLKKQIETIKSSDPYCKAILESLSEDPKFYTPSIHLISPENKALSSQELFGPAFMLIPFERPSEAIEWANKCDFGLGASLWGSEDDQLLNYAKLIESGAVTINDLVKSDPLIPFGGCKKSGYGKELGPEGILEFCNVQTIVMST